MSECDLFVMEDQNEEWFKLVEYVETFDMSISFLEGLPGPPGPAGEAIFIPHVSQDGVLSWTNTAGLPNPDPIDLSGPAGTTDYADLINRPSINGVELIGNKTTAGLLISFSKADVGLGNVDNVRQYSASNPPPYPVTAINGKTGAVSLDASDVGAFADDATIPVANGGTGATSGANALANLGVTEAFSFGNGSLKLPNGTLIQWGEKTLDVANALTQIGTSGVYQGQANLVFPVAFANTSYYLSGRVRYSRGHDVPCGFVAGTSSAAMILIYDFYARPASSTDYKLYWFAIGRWA